MTGLGVRNLLISIHFESKKASKYCEDILITGRRMDQAAQRISLDAGGLARVFLMIPCSLTEWHQSRV